MINYIVFDGDGWPVKTGRIQNQNLTLVTQQEADKGNTLCAIDSVAAAMPVDSVGFDGSAAILKTPPLYTVGVLSIGVGEDLTISGLPNPARAVIENQIIDVDDGVFEFSANYPGEYTLCIKSQLYADIEYQVTVT